MGHHDPDIVNRGTKPEMGYEYRDIDLPKIGKGTVIFFIFTAVSVFVTIPMFTLLVHGTLNPTAINKPIRDPKPVALPPAPHPLVQTNTTTKSDIHEYRKAEHEKAYEYGVADKAKGTYRIPVTEAMEEIAAKGLNGPTN